MVDNTRFGLPLSLTEALRADPSPQAAALADLLADDAPVRRTFSPARGRRWRAALAGLTLAAGCVTQGNAATSSLEGRWIMAPALSSFQEAVTGPAPDQATVIVTRDDHDRLAYELSESRSGVPVAHGSYDVSFAGATSTSSVDGARLPVTAERDARGDVVIRAPAVDGLRALIHVRRTGQDTALLEHTVEGVDGAHELERISLIRSYGSAN